MSSLLLQSPSWRSGLPSPCVKACWLRRRAPRRCRASPQLSRRARLRSSPGQFRTLAWFAVLALILLSLLPADTAGIRFGRSLFFVIGALFSSAIAYLGMGLATRANLRVAAAAREPNGAENAVKIAFRTGGVVGFMTVGLGLLGAATVVGIYQGDAPPCSRASASARLCSPCSSESEAASHQGGRRRRRPCRQGRTGHSEDDPRNAATIADVGDNVGDCAGMAADLFESYAVTLVAALIGRAAFGERPRLSLIVPPGVVTAIIGVFLPGCGPPTERHAGHQPRLLRLGHHLGVLCARHVSTCRASSRTSTAAASPRSSATPATRTRASWPSVPSSSASCSRRSSSCSPATSPRATGVR
jgi:hypothetical protein